MKMQVFAWMSDVETRKMYLRKHAEIEYRKVPKFSDAIKLRCNLPKIQTKRPNLRVFRQKDANGIVNSEDPDQTAPLEQSDLGLHCLPRPICPKI